MAPNIAALAVSLAFVTLEPVLPGLAGTDENVDRIARLVKQLGDEQFDKREAASKELEAIGEPALPHLRKAETDEDAEIRRRASQAIRAISRRLGKRELARWEGSWTGDAGVTMTIKGDWFTSATPSTGPRNGTMTVLEVGEKTMQVDMLVEEGDTKGQTFKAIFRLDGETLHSCGTYGDARPVAFRSEGGNYYIPWKRVKK